MNVWMSVWMDVQMVGWINRWLGGWMDGWMIGLVLVKCYSNNIYSNKQISNWMDRQMDECIDGQKRR